MLTQELLNVCSIRHLHQFSNARDADQNFQKAIKESFKIQKVDSENPPGDLPDCTCVDCNKARAEFKKKYKGTSPSILTVWNYRLLLAVSGIGGGIYLVNWLKSKQFEPIQEYVGYNGKKATIWTLHIPTWFEQNKIPYDAKTFEIPKEKAAK